MKLLKKLYRISSPSNQEALMQKFIISLLKGANIPYSVDKKGNIYATKGESDTYPCVACHIDEVHKFRKDGYKVMESDGVLYGFNPNTMSFEGIGADDKNGIWVCIKALNEFDAIKCAFFVAEEVGCQGSRAAEMAFFDDCRFVLQCDRKGNSDFITNASCTELCSKEFVKDANISAFGYKEANGLMTDVMELKERGLKVSACNISCGYYNPHTNNEMTRISDLLNCYNLVRNIITNCVKTYPHKYVAPKYTGYTGKYGGYYDGWGGYYGYKKDEIIENLKELYTSAWKTSGGVYMVYDQTTRKTREASSGDLAYANNIDTYRFLFDHYDELKFDKDGNPFVKMRHEKEFYSPDRELVNEYFSDVISSEYDEMMQEMNDRVLEDPAGFKLDEFIALYSDFYPNLAYEDYAQVYEELTGCAV